MSGPRWPQEIDSRRISLVKAGLSSAQIAAALNNEFGTSFSRNSVIGRTHRKNGNGVLTASRGPRPEVPMPKAPRPRTHHNVTRLLSIAAGTDPGLPPPRNDADRAVKHDDLLIPLSQRKSLVDLTATCCHWPVGDPLKPDFFFCGAEALDGSPYCPVHFLRAYQPAKRGGEGRYHEYLAKRAA